MCVIPGVEEEAKKDEYMAPGKTSVGRPRLGVGNFTGE